MTHTAKEYDDLDYRDCTLCGDDVHIDRWQIGYHICRACGDQVAADARRVWCVVQEYGKGPYQFVTSASAHKAVKDTNQKSPRS